ncbi:glycosyltransferase family 4 protein [Gordonia otitidis]|uniref:Glycosyltransferase n=1 Tax=Gordonia otitidis (strain DSM 44809 / CCUG 52243 / JCM 12355 / NBRC 100426 / IFM 10032) TaxID=1108044 RepID=H5TRM3_GORO1|nr:glycosyltransferase family 4 protein [Gordonia otitidis]GAB36131.1 putative glycosyltransferase [Gordonia otitidis NBRC 100426]
MPDRRLRIAVIASSSYPITQPFAGGLEAHVWHLTRALSSAGHQVTLFAGPGSDEGPDTDMLHTNIFEPSHAARADVSMPPEQVLREHHAYLSLMVDLAAHPERFDVIHNHSLHHLPVAMADAVATPMVTTLHTPPTPWLESAMTIADQTRCVAVSQHTADAWSHILDAVPVIHNGVQVRDWAPGPGGEDAVWFGRLVPEKGVHLAIDAARRADIGLRIAGPISDLSYYADRVEPFLDERIRYVGHLDHHKLADLVGRSSVTLVSPVWDEPYGLVVAESLSCGTPVASFRRGGIPEIVGTQAGILVAPDDVDELAKAAIDAQRFDRKAVRDHAERHCSEEVMIEKYQDLYAELVQDEALRA